MIEKSQLRTHAFKMARFFGSLASHHPQVCTIPPPNYHHQQLCLLHLCPTLHLLGLTDQEDLLHNEAVQLLCGDDVVEGKGEGREIYPNSAFHFQMKSYMQKAGDSWDISPQIFLDFPQNFRLRTRNQYCTQAIA